MPPKSTPLTEPSADFSTAERKRLIADCLRWKIELEYEEQWDNRESYVDWLKAMEDNELRRQWETTVGEWLAYRQDCVLQDETSWESYIGSQFEALINGEKTDYGSLCSVNVEQYYTA
jgi:hypothetical protein